MQEWLRRCFEEGFRFLLIDESGSPFLATAETAIGRGDCVLLMDLVRAWINYLHVLGERTELSRNDLAKIAGRTVDEGAVAPASLK